MKHFTLGSKVIFVALISWFIACDGRIGLENSEMEIISPTTGDHWQVGEDTTAVIVWTQVDAFGPIRIDLYKDNAFYTNIATGARVIDLEYRWTVPGSVEPDRRFTVYIESEWDSTLNATSKQFDIDGYATSSVLTVTAPANRDTWQSGVQDNAIIRWTYSDLSGAIKIVLYNAESPVATIADSAALADTAYYWTVPQSVLAGSSHRIYLESLADQYVGAYSDEFEILPSDTPSSLAVTSPGKNTGWQVGLINGAVVNWTHENLTGTVKLDLYQSDAFVISIVDSVDAEAGTYSWTVPLDVVDGRNYQVYIQSNDLSNVNHLGDDFRIDPFDSEPALSVSSPGRDDLWVLGRPDGALIEWAYANVTGSVTIDLYDGRNYLSTIADTFEISIGNYSWTVPDSLPTGSRYNIVISSHELPALVGYGDNFTIADMASVAILTVTSPLADVFYLLGQETEITWTAEYLTGTVTIDLYNGRNLVENLTNSADVMLGVYDWVVPDVLPTGTNYNFLITSNELPTIEGQSDNFSILDLADVAVLELTSPIASDIWILGFTAGSVTNWYSEYLTGTVRIDLYDHRTFVMTIGADIPIEAGTYVWTADSIKAGTRYNITITSNELSEIFSSSDNFNILDLASVASVSPTRPGTGDVWVVSEPDGAFIQWHSQFLTGIIKIDLYDGKTYALTIADNTDLNDGSMFWTVPNSLQPGTTYSILLTSNDIPEITGTGTAFSIQDSTSLAELTLLKPDAETIWFNDSTGVIEWSSAYLTGTITLELWDNKLEAAIADSILVTAGSYTWDIPAAIPQGTRYKVLIRSNDLPDVEFESPTFYINEASQ